MKFNGLTAAIALGFCLLCTSLAKAEDTNGYYMLQPLQWKGNVVITMTGFLPAAGLTEVLDNGVVGLYNYNNDIYVGYGFVPEKRNGNMVFRDIYAEFVYTIKTGKFTYLDRYGFDTLAVLSYNDADDMYYANDLAECISKIKGQGTIFDPVVPFFNDGYGITLYNSDEGTPFAVTDSVVQLMGSGNLLQYVGYPYPGTKVKVTLKRRTGKINIKYKTTTQDPGNPQGSLQPSLMWWVEGE